MEYLAWAAADDQPEPQSITSASVAHAGAYLAYAEKMFERSISGLGISRQETDAALIARHIRMEELTGEIDPFEEYLRGGKQLDLWQPEKN